MSKDKLVVVERHYAYQIAWHLADEGDYGAFLGDGGYTKRDLKSATGDSREAIVAELAAKETEGVHRDNDGFRWDSSAAVRKALRSINLALKLDGGAPWPEWAKQAHAAGWKAPKGWRP